VARSNFWIGIRSGNDFVPVESIDWIESANNYTLLHCRSKDYLFGENLSALERMLDPNAFMRVHRCHMVNLSRTSAVHAIAGGIFSLELRGGTRVSTGRQYNDRIRKLLTSVDT
jgi:two-component system LytT family response regulator